jgi:hypothetical protein
VFVTDSKHLRLDLDHLALNGNEFGPNFVNILPSYTEQSQGNDGVSRENEAEAIDEPIKFR